MAIKVVYRLINLNPEPWATGSLGVVRGQGGRAFPKMSPNEQLESFKNAVQEELEGQAFLPFEDIELEFYFWRRLDRYQGPKGRWVNKKAADATNLQKGLEDALQGWLFHNDRQVKQITSRIVSQSHETKPMILIVAREYIDKGFPDVPQEIQNDINTAWHNPAEFEQLPLFEAEVVF